MLPAPGSAAPDMVPDKDLPCQTSRARKLDHVLYEGARGAATLGPLVALGPTTSGMNSLYNLAGRQSASIQADLTSYASDPLSQSVLRPQITAALSAMVKTVEDYEAMAKRELVIAKREKALGRAAHFYQEIKKFREQLSSIDAGASAATSQATLGHTSSIATSSARTRTIDSHGPSFHMTPQAPRQNLTNTFASPSMQTPYAIPNTVTAPSFSYAQPNDPLAAYRLHQPVDMYNSEERPYSMRESHALREHSFIQNTENQLDAFIAQGRSVLGNLVEQRGILKNTRRRLLDAANSVGMSREVIVRMAFSHSRVTLTV